MRLVTSALLLIAVTAAPVMSQENPIEAAVKASLDNPNRPFTMFVRARVKEGSGPKFEAAFVRALVETRKEKGNRAYELIRTAKDSTEYIVYERWQDLAALQAHLRTPYITALLTEIHELLEAPPDLKVGVTVGE